MVFTNFKGFFYARNELRLFRIEKVNELDSTLYRDYTLVCAKDEFNFQNELLTYKSIKKGFFKENDEILVSNLDKKLVLVKNFTQKTDNFKEALAYQFVLLGFLFFATVFFAVLSGINEFSAVDLIFFMLCLLLLVMALINFSLLRKQIQILNRLDKERVREFLKQKL